MTPSLEEVSDLFEKVANDKKINLEDVDINWLTYIMQCTQICDFKNTEIFTHYVETALDNIPPQALKQTI